MCIRDRACADRLDDGIEIIYTFENTAKLLNLKMVVAEEQTVDSITFVFWTAFDAELDIARDCGVKFKHVACLLYTSSGTLNGYETVSVCETFQ